MVERQTTKSTDRVLEASLTSLGLTPEPFLHLQALQDRRLREYMVVFDLSWAVLGDQNSIFWAPPGGGKSALRMYLMQNCWAMLGSPHPLPVYVTPQRPSDLVVDSEAVLMELLLRSTVASLGAGLLYQPSRLRDLSVRQRRFLGRCFRSYLAAAPEYLLQRLRDSGSAAEFADVLAPNYWVHVSMPDSAHTRMFAAFLENAAVEASCQPRTLETLESVLEELIDLICGPLQFRSVLLLVDAVDTFSGFAAMRSEVARWLYGIGELIRPRPQVWLKAFMASDPRYPIERLLSSRPDGLPIADHYTLHWTQERLIEMLQLRIRVASGNRLATFDAFTGPDFVEGLETLLVGRVPRRPRDVLRLTQQTLREHWLRVGGTGGHIEHADLDKALRTIELESRTNQSSQLWLD